MNARRGETKSIKRFEKLRDVHFVVRRIHEQNRVQRGKGFDLREGQAGAPLVLREPLASSRISTASSHPDFPLTVPLRPCPKSSETWEDRNSRQKAARSMPKR